MRELPFGDREDFKDARRGLIASAEALLICDARGRAVWDMDLYAFVDPEDPSPPTVHPSQTSVVAYPVLRSVWG